MEFLKRNCRNFSEFDGDGLKSLYEWPARAFDGIADVDHHAGIKYQLRPLTIADDGSSMRASAVNANRFMTHFLECWRAQIPREQFATRPAEDLHRAAQVDLQVCEL